MTDERKVTGVVVDIPTIIRMVKEAKQAEIEARHGREIVEMVARYAARKIKENEK